MKKLRFITAAALLCGAAAALSAQDALGRFSVTAMRAEPRHGAEQISQTLMGTPLTVLERGREWSRVKGPDGYEGWMINHSLVFLTPEQRAKWNAGPLVMITAPYELHDADRRTDLVSGDILLHCGPDSLMLPDGRMIAIPQEGTRPLTSFGEFRPELLPRWAEQYLGVPYLWGGLSSKGMDCSGLVRMAYMAQGRLVPRDAWQQALEGREVPADSLQPGDLIFFGRKRITHVAIYAGNGEYIHASQMVRRNSLNPRSPLYIEMPPILARRRVQGTKL